MKRRIWYVVPLAVLALGASALPGFAADTGTVNAQVVAGSGAACLTVSTSVNFGTAPFNGATSTTVVGTPNIVVTSCGVVGKTETILVRGTDATATGATWTLTTAVQCNPQSTPNLYNLGLRLTGGTDTLLAPTNTSLGTLAGSASLTRTPILRMPCTGSAGSGQTMAMSYVFTATVP